MRNSLDNIIFTDILVIGSGIAGLTFALEVAEFAKVLVISKDDPLEGSTKYAQGGIASVIDPLDSFDAHIKDTLQAGAGLCKKEIVELVVKEGPQRVLNLIELGAQFDKNQSSENYSLGKEGGHSARRILHSRDSTGAEIQRVIFEKAKSNSNIKILPFHIAIDLIKDEEQICGAYVFDKKKEDILTISAKATLLATGGVGKAYLYTSNPDVATGDGIAMAYRAGAKIENMEFIQFHPTCLYHPNAKSFLITEAMRGEGAKLLTTDKNEFMYKYHELKELAPRDIVARAIDSEMKNTGADYVYLDISHKDKDFITSRFPMIYEKTKSFGFDITKEPIPVVPAAHYCCGGVSTNENGQTTIKNLYSAGETACTGLHGGNRLASNSLLEALVFSHRAAKHLQENYLKLEHSKSAKVWDYLDTQKSNEEVLVAHMWDEVRRTMWNLVGIVRSNKRLNLALKRIQTIENEISEYYWNFRITNDLIELRNIVVSAKLITTAAIAQKKNVGLHYNIDN